MRLCAASLVKPFPRQFLQLWLGQFAVCCARLLSLPQLRFVGCDLRLCLRCWASACACRPDKLTICGSLCIVWRCSKPRVLCSSTPRDQTATRSPSPCDTDGDPLKTTFGPSLNILVKPVSDGSVPPESLLSSCSQLNVSCSSDHARELGPKGSDCHKAAVIGDTVGDPLKDTSGPSLNILVKLMAVESLVFAPFFSSAVCGSGEGMIARFLGHA